MERFRDQLQHVDWRRIVLGMAMVVFCYWLRAARWAVLIKPQKKVSSFALLGSQVIGLVPWHSSAVGRTGYPVPGCQANHLPLTSQIAVYTVERMFDLGAMAMNFSAALLLAPDPRRCLITRPCSMPPWAALAVTVFLAIFAIAVRASRRAVALLRKRPRLCFAVARSSVGIKIHAFRDGLDSIATLGDFLRSWAFPCPCGAYYGGLPRDGPRFCALAGVICDDFRPLHGIDGGEHGWLHRPIAGDRTVHPIGVTTGVMQKVFHVQFEPALACGAMLLIGPFMCVIPFGLIWARVEHVSLKKSRNNRNNSARKMPNGRRSSARPTLLEPFLTTKGESPMGTLS